MRVLRARGADPVACHHRPRSRPPEPGLELNGVVLTMYDGRTNLSADVAAEVRRHLGAAVFETVIPRSVRLSEAPSYGLPIALYAPDSQGRGGVRRARTRVRATRKRRRLSRAAPRPRRRIRDRKPLVLVMTVRPEREQGLGRGLAALIPQRAAASPDRPRSRSPASARIRTSRDADSTRPSWRRSPRASASTACSSRSS